MESASNKCAQCAHPKCMGALCWRCYIRSLGYQKGLNRYRWWSHWFDVIEAHLRARYEVVRLGAEPIPVEQSLKLIWKVNPRPKWASHKHKGTPQSKADVLRIIAFLEQKARREYEANCARET